MRIALIPPNKYLKKYKNDSDIYMCLAPFLDDEDYKKFFKKRAAKGNFIIMDNGAAEGKILSDDEIVKRAIEIGVSEVIAPDYLNDSQKTIYATNRFLDKYYQILATNKIQIMGVVQGNSIEAALESFKNLKIDTRIDTIGLPFAGLDFFPEFDILNAINKTQRNALSRLFFRRMLGDTKPIHLLGLYNPLELGYQQAVRSCDTSLPFKAALVEEYISDFGIIEKPEYSLNYFTSEFDDEMNGIIDVNIRKLKEHARN